MKFLPFPYFNSNWQRGSSLAKLIPKVTVDLDTVRFNRLARRIGIHGIKMR